MLISLKQLKTYGLDFYYWKRKYWLFGCVNCDSLKILMQWALPAIAVVGFVVTSVVSDSAFCVVNSADTTALDVVT